MQRVQYSRLSLSRRCNSSALPYCPYLSLCQPFLLLLLCCCLGCLCSLPRCYGLHSTAQHSTAQHSTAQHSTAQHSTSQHITAQHSTAQHSTAQHRTAQHIRMGTVTTHPRQLINIQGVQGVTKTLQRV
jgi:hypothetical protein